MFLSWSADWLDRAEALKSVDDRAEALAGETGDSPPGRVSRRGDSPRREGESSRGRAKEPVVFTGRGRARGGQTRGCVGIIATRDVARRVTTATTRENMRSTAAISLFVTMGRMSCNCRRTRYALTPLWIWHPSLRGTI